MRLADVVRHANARSWVVGFILAHLVPSRDDTSSHVIQTRDRNTAVGVRLGEVVSPVGLTVRHGHVKTSQGCGNTAMLGKPVGNDEPLETKFGLEKSVQGLAVLAGIGVVYSVVRAPAQPLVARSILVHFFVQHT